MLTSAVGVAVVSAVGPLVDDAISLVDCFCLSICRKIRFLL